MSNTVPDLQDTPTACQRMLESLNYVLNNHAEVEKVCVAFDAFVNVQRHKARQANSARILYEKELQAEITRLKDKQRALARYIKPYFDGSKIQEGSLWPDSDTILCDFVDEDVFDEVIAPCAVCHSPENDYKHREDHFYKAPVKA